MSEPIDSIGERAMRLLEVLTPGGSEFHNNPERCAQWVTERRKTEHEALIKNATLRHHAERRADRDAAIIDMVDSLVAPFAWTDAMDSDGAYSFSFGEMMVKAVKDGRALALEIALAARVTP